MKLEQGRLTGSRLVFLLFAAPAGACTPESARLRLARAGKRTKKAAAVTFHQQIQ